MSSTWCCCPAQWQLFRLFHPPRRFLPLLSSSLSFLLKQTQGAGQQGCLTCPVGCWSLPFTQALPISIFMDDFLDPLSIGLGCEEHHSRLTWALLLEYRLLNCPSVHHSFGSCSWHQFRTIKIMFHSPCWYFFSHVSIRLPNVLSLKVLLLILTS